MIRRALATLALALTFASAAEAQTGSRLTLSSDVAILKGLDKISGRTTEIQARVGRPVTFGTLEITARACRKSPPEDRPETAVYLEIVDRPLRPVDQETAPEPSRVFSGWVFASTPAANALEHPVYDVWAITCRT